ncbi:nuclear transport factor 2 family protein [Burkholderia oklahomensis]|uniref:nuclear transport factor 2 family protein n=1 Tax=Burkholderia oklahomensis TaxID=342113 RepID=UPI0026546BE0|nr:nuclear transport factor 2 family protein [Burkholderia oklahomensis]MDN7671543.1 nuclear transport factor 2 family protein [Burkholderia oklahomensis]
MQAHRPYFDEIVAGGDAIRGWLSGDVSGPAALDALMARFAPRFTMIGTDGNVYDHAAAHALFARLHGRKPGLKITFAEMRALAADPALGVVSYCEFQTDATGALPTRRSTAVFERDPQTGAVRWTHLQETFCVA